MGTTWESLFIEHKIKRLDSIPFRFNYTHGFKKIKQCFKNIHKTSGSLIQGRKKVILMQVLLIKTNVSFVHNRKWSCWVSIYTELEFGIKERQAIWLLTTRSTTHKIRHKIDLQWIQHFRLMEHRSRRIRSCYLQRKHLNTMCLNWIPLERFESKSLPSFASCVPRRDIFLTNNKSSQLFPCKNFFYKKTCQHDLAMLSSYLNVSPITNIRLCH